MKKMMNKKGFTMAELLIVVAIIAVLVAIAIPVFTRQLDRSRAATDTANIRAGYADVTTRVLTDNVSNSTFSLQVDGTVSGTNNYACKGKATDADSAATIGGTYVTSIGWEKGNNIIYSVDSEQNVTIDKK